MRAIATSLTRKIELEFEPGVTLTTAQVAAIVGTDKRTAAKAVHRLVAADRLMIIGKDAPGRHRYQRHPESKMTARPAVVVITSVQHAIATQPKSIFHFAELQR